MNSLTPMATVKRVAPIFPVRDLSTSLVHYRRLGFTTRKYDNGGYGYATRDGIEIHLGVIPDTPRSTTSHSAYLWVDDADALALELVCGGSRGPSARGHRLGPERGRSRRPRRQCAQIWLAAGTPTR